MPTQNKNFNSSFANKDPVHNRLAILVKGLKDGGDFGALFADFQESLKGLLGDMKEDEYKLYLDQLVKNRGLDLDFSRQISQFLSVRSVIEQRVKDVEERVAKSGVVAGSTNSLDHSKPGPQQSKHFGVVDPPVYPLYRIGNFTVHISHPGSLALYRFGKQTKYPGGVATKLQESAEVAESLPLSRPLYKTSNVVVPIAYTPAGIIVHEGVLKYMIELYNQIAYTSAGIEVSEDLLKYMIELYNQKAGTSFALSQGASARLVPYGLLAAALGIEISPPRRAIGWFTKTPLGGYTVSGAIEDKARSDNLALASPMPKAGGETVRDYFLPNGGSEMDVSRCLFPEDKKREESADQSASKSRVRSSWIRAVVSFITYPVRMLLLACWMILSTIWAGMSVMSSKLLGGFSSQVAWDEPAKVNFEIASTPSGEFRGVPRVNSRGAKVPQSNFTLENAARL